MGLSSYARIGYLESSPMENLRRSGDAIRTRGVLYIEGTTRALRYRRLANELHQNLVFEGF